MFHDGYHFWGMHIIWCSLGLLFFSAFLGFLSLFAKQELKKTARLIFCKNVLLQAKFQRMNIKTTRKF